MRNRLKVLAIVLCLIASQKGYADYTAGDASGSVIPEIANFEAQGGEASTESSAANPFIEEDGLTIIDPAWLEDKSGQNIQQMTAIGQQIAQSGSGFTKDPKTNSYVAAAGSSIGATGALIGSAYHLDRAGKYGEASSRNSAAALATQGEIDGVQNQIDAAQREFERESLKAQKASFFDEKNQAAKKIEFAAAQEKMEELQVKQKFLEAQKKELETKKTAQESLAGEYSFSEVGSGLMAGLGVVSSAAMAGTGVMQLEQGRKLASDNDYCAKHPNEFPRCTEVVPQGDNQPLNPIDQNPPTSLNDPGFSGFNRDGADEDKFSPASASAAGLGTAPTVGAAGSPSFGGGLSGDDRNSAKEKELDDIGGSGFSADQSYEGGGGNIDQLGSGSMASSLIAPPFDISQFLPANLKEDELGGFYAAKINENSKEKEEIVLGKESPSLFTRISKAYQKRAHEMLKGVI
ncbi:MAG: hypothetical protein AAB309_02215 [Deltaproteobacteria bacterium]